MMKKLFLALTITLLLSTFALADQLQWISLKTAQDAVKIIKRNPYLIGYCSECDRQSVQVWKVKDALITHQKDNYYSVTIVGKRVYESKNLFDSGGYFEPVQYSVSTAPNPDDLWFVGDIDLAYVYVPLGSRTFDNLAEFMGYTPAIRVKRITLPMDISQ